MKLKNKGRVYPSPSSSSSCSCEDYLSILKLLPAAILGIASVLSLEDREVLAYMITRSLKTTTTAANSSLISQDYSSKKRSSKKPPPTATKLTQKDGALPHKPPVFDCDCFDCYTSYWFRWDSSPNRELIHQVIEAFEDHLTNGEAQKPSKKNTRPKKRDSSSKVASRVPDSPVVDLPVQPDQEVLVLKSSSTEEASVFNDDVTSREKDVEEEVADVAEVTEELAVAEDAEEQIRTAATSSHKGLARKVLPDVLGLLNSRLWGLWNPNV
ncbi:uncharacterized protein LOC110418965 [Herrania umbratica]|uniref:Uncharacterized protein LOC110418965 n=1 Tax=Herrania umbratica TaxID=108875 RepID=A0A6J1AKX6_9ROSI|nr:uncharacterized protein LOC110418965 [Herrania umbratica]